MFEQPGLKPSEGQTAVPFGELVGTSFRGIDNNDYYVTTQYGTFLPGSDYEAMYNSGAGFEVRISGIVRAKEGTSMSMLAAGIAYSDALTKRIIDAGSKSDIVKAQQAADVNIMTMQEFGDGEKDMFIAYLGGSSVPYMILLFPSSFEAKDEVIAYLDAFNEGKSEDDVVTYTDLAGTMSSMTSGIMDGITIVLIAFAAISLVVSMIMICIITYTSVIERTKEIGILKALGARKKDITRVFDAETMILGVFSGLLGVFIAWLCTFPINNVINRFAGLTGASHLQLKHALILVAVSTVLTVIGGHIPAKMASKKDAVEALRAE
ncbi:MAG: FtsX-like permease family protein, partial [Lachnospiraceae bacterium]|nr:FtsX-like permease family protein [Lachnospiraceae bacterium]